MKVQELDKLPSPKIALACIALAASVALLFATDVMAQDELAMDGMGNISEDVFAGSSPAAVLYKARCAQCHDKPVGRVPPRASLRYRPPEGIYEAMASGVMAPMAIGLTDEQIKSLAKLLTGREPKSIPDPTDKLCKKAPAKVLVAEGDWSSTHGDVQGRRFRRSAAFSASSINRLKLKWSYAIPGGAKGPVTVAGDSLFLASTGYVIALNKSSGCVRWAYPTAGRTIRAVTAANPQSASGADADTAHILNSGGVALFGDDSGTVFALNAATGAELWKTNVESHVLGRITAAPTVHNGIVYVPISSMEDPLTHDDSYFCCSARGGVAALDLNTGQQLWKQQHISEPLAPLEQHVVEESAQALSTEHFDQGPAGASTYTPLTIDARRGLVYASTAEEYGFTGVAGPYSVVAYELKTGVRAWQQSLIPAESDRRRLCAERETDCRNMFSTGTSVLVHPLSKERDVLLIATKAGAVHGLDPDNKGNIVWTSQVAEGGDLGGIMYGLSSDANTVYVPVADVDSPTGRFTGSLVALDPATGIVAWRASAPAPACNWDNKNCIGGQVAATTVVSDMVFTGFWDGYVRIYSTLDGRLLKEIDTALEFSAVNGVASGGQVSGYPLTVGKDALYINSGASSIMKSGNALLVYTLDGK